jgi:hypothetical protein
LNEDNDVETNFPPEISPRHKYLPHKKFYIFQSILILIYTTTFSVLYSYSTSSQLSPKDGFAPAMSSLFRKPRTFAKHGNHVSPYAQPPSPTTSLAWSNLLAGGNMRVTPAEMSQYRSSSVLLADNSGDSLAKMAFYHELHCLYKLKTHLYPEHYYSNSSQEYMEEERDHLEHCIEWIRTAAICRGDTTLTLFEWVGEEGKERLETKYPIPHMCYIEEDLLSWSEKEGRRVDIDEDGVLVGPGGNGSSKLIGGR